MRKDSPLADRMLEILIDGVSTRRYEAVLPEMALRSAIDAVFGADQLVQRCRNHKQRNVASRLPKDQQTQALATMRAAFKLEAAEGTAKLSSTPPGWSGSGSGGRPRSSRAWRSSSRSTGWG
jgi:transposase-like protein